MNKEQAKEWLPLIQALAEGKTLQRVRSKDFGFATAWYDIKEESHLDFRLPASCYRIKQEPKKGWYRVLLAKNHVGRFYTTTADSELSEKEWLKDSRFIEWLTDRIEYELPEGEV